MTSVSGYAAFVSRLICKDAAEYLPAGREDLFEVTWRIK